MTYSKLWSVPVTETEKSPKVIMREEQYLSQESAEDHIFGKLNLVPPSSARRRREKNA
jgi:hypothetical protein